MDFLKLINAGHLRAFITALFTVTFVVGFFMGTITAETLVPMATMVIGFYFGTNRPDVKKDENGQVDQEAFNALQKDVKRIKVLTADSKPGDLNITL